MHKVKTKGLVYSTETGRICAGCGHALKQCCCSSKKNVPPGDGLVRIMRQTKGRKGSGVCLITGIPLGQTELKKLAKQLKKKCGSGGTVKDGIIEIQGNHCEILVQTLKEFGFKAKQAGG